VALETGLVAVPADDDDEEEEESLRSGTMR
jgi:hypothetical protein